MAKNLVREAFLVRKGHLGSFSLLAISHRRWGLSWQSQSYLHNMNNRSLINVPVSKFATQPTKLSEDRIEMFINPQVQSILKSLTGKNFQTIFRTRKLGQRLKEPHYAFMTENQLQETVKEAQNKADKLLEMPPVLRSRKPINSVLSFDPDLQGIENSTIILTDVSINVHPRERLIVARDPDGTLRHASWEERDKMNMIYFPTEGRELNVPKMFSDPDLFNDVLNRATEKDNTYEFILDKACLQFEPDHPQYIKICEETYNVVDKNRHYEFLKSTRHLGPMIFYLARTRKMDNLLNYYIQQGRVLNDCLQLVTLFHILFPESKSNIVSSTSNEPMKKIRSYLELDSIQRSELDLSLNAYEEQIKKREELSEELVLAHGMQN